MGWVLVTTSLAVAALTVTPSTPGICVTSLRTAASQCPQLIPLTRYSLVGMPLLRYRPAGVGHSILPVRRSGLLPQVRPAAMYQT
jgi:hypothetical protein